MGNSIGGEELLDELKRSFGVSSASELVVLTGYTKGRLSQIKNERLGAKAVAKLIKRSTDAGTENHASLIRPVVELFQVEPDSKSEKDFIDTRLDDRKKLKRLLEKEIGIYSFYNSELEVVYVGKTKTSLWKEMKQTYNRKMPRYKRYQVNHPHGRFSSPTDGVRQMKLGDFHFYDAVSYFSAYVVPENFIDIVETLLIRIFANELINVQMAGNKSLIAFDPEEM